MRLYFNPLLKLAIGQFREELVVFEQASGADYEKSLKTLHDLSRDIQFRLGGRASRDTKHQQIAIALFQQAINNFYPSDNDTELTQSYYNNIRSRMEAIQNDLQQGRGGAEGRRV